MIKVNSIEKFGSGKNLRILIGLAILLALIVISLFMPNSAMRFGSKHLKYEIVDTSAEREKGLSGRTSLGADQAMLFVFDTADKYCFWMKDMKFPIDMVWLDSSKKVVHMEQNVDPSTYPHSFCSETGALYVVEVNAGIIQKTGLKTAAKI